MLYVVAPCHLVTEYIMSNRLLFLYSAVADIQATIRATDVKLGFLFVVIFAPLTAVPVIAQFILINSNNCYVLFPVLVIGLLWLLSFVGLFNAVGALSPPATHVLGDTGTGIYHGSGLFSVGLVDVFFNFPIKSNFSVAEVLNAMPGSDDDLESEMIFELLKVSYIRDVKISRFMFSLKCTFLWIAIAMILMIYSYHGGLIPNAK
jgi:hypothetical protein